MHEVKFSIKWADVKRCPEGYAITFKPAKQQGPVKLSEFIIPKKPKGVDGTDFYAIFDKYIGKGHYTLTCSFLKKVKFSRILYFKKGHY